MAGAFKVTANRQFFNELVPETLSPSKEGQYEKKILYSACIIPGFVINIS